MILRRVNNRIKDKSLEERIRIAKNLLIKLDYSTDYGKKENIIIKL